MIRTHSAPLPRARVVVVAALATVAISAGAAVSTEREVGACSCSGPHIALLEPEQADDVPLNAKVRLEVPATSPAIPPTLVLRVHGRTAPVAVSTRVIASGGYSSFLELTPSAPLDPSTRYEVATVDATAIPPNRVFGTFRTGSASDTTAPRIDAMGPAIAYTNANAMGSMCMVAGPWVTIEGVVAEDPGRRDAQLVFAVWLGDASGAIDPKKPPTSLVQTRSKRLDVGQTSVCDPHAFPFPKAPVAWLGIAALDEAGNASAVRRVRVDLTRARQP